MFIVNGQVNEGRRDAAARGAAGLDRLEGLAVEYAAADILDDGAQVGAHGDFDQTGPVDLAGQGKGLGAPALVRAETGIPGCSLLHDGRDGGQGFHVVDVGRLAKEAGHGREGRAGAGHAALTLNALHQRGFLAADKGAGTFFDLDVKVEARAENGRTQKAVLPHLADGGLHPFDR